VKFSEVTKYEVQLDR
jgi:hypothetical protein